MAAADLALACSGTVTTELAVQGCPMIVGYKLDWLTWFLADKFLFQGDYITLFNVAAQFAALKAMGFGRAPASQITAETLLEMI